MDQQTTVFDTKPLLRPAQLKAAREEIDALKEKVTAPGIEDKAEAIRQLQRVSKTVAEQTPRPPKDGEEEGAMVRRSEQLLRQIVEDGMCSQEEMRKAPPGAVDKHMKWEARNKAAILEWKNLQLRLTHGSEPEAANLERHRPTGSSLNMDNAAIAGRSYFMPEVSGPVVTFDDGEIALLAKHAPDIACRLALMDNGQRGEVKRVLEQFKEA
jgi:hypothetical protein